MTKPSTRLRIASVEDDPTFRASLSALLLAMTEFAPVIPYRSAELAIREAERCRRLGDPCPWDMVLMDLDLPNMGGVEATASLKRLYPDLRIVVLTVFETPSKVLAAVSVGADGYLLKNADPMSLAHEIELAARFGATLSPRLAQTVLNALRFQTQRDGSGADGAGEALGLSDRQISVIKALAEGRSYQQIAEEMDLAIDTVRWHIRRIYSVLQVQSAAQAVARAISHGLI
jgi:DNA-binding NarL/FixJ family response regulator